MKNAVRAPPRNGAPTVVDNTSMPPSKRHNAVETFGYLASLHRGGPTRVSASQFGGDYLCLKTLLPSRTVLMFVSLSPFTYFISSP